MVSGYVKGLLEISVEGMNLERFLNLCVENGIPLQNINRPRYGQMTCVIKADDLRTICLLYTSTASVYQVSVSASEKEA